MSEAQAVELKKLDKTEPLNVYQMISEVTRRLVNIGGVGKDGVNEYDKYKFRGIDQVYDALAPIISSVGLVILPNVSTRQAEIRQAKSGGALNFVTLDVQYTLVSNQDGSSVVVSVPGEAMDRSDKATNKALSAAYKYMCFQVFCIPLEGQEADAESPELGKNPNTTGRKPESAAKTAGKAFGELSQTEKETLDAINMACFNEDPHGFYELWDELDTDGKTRVWGELHRDERKVCKEWQDQRKAADEDVVE